MGRPPVYADDKARQNARRAQIRESVRRFRQRQKGTVAYRFRTPRSTLEPAVVGSDDADDSYEVTDRTLGPEDFAAHSSHALIDLAWGVLDCTMEACHFVIDQTFHANIRPLITSSNRLVEIALFATGSRVVGHTSASGNTWFKRLAYQAYGQTLQQFRLILKDITMYTPDVTSKLLITACALHYHDLFDIERPDASMNHLDAMQAICKAAGPTVFQDPTCQWLLRNYGPKFHTISVFRREPCFLAAEDWKTIPYALVARSNYDKTYGNVYPIGSLLHQSDTFLIQNHDQVPDQGLTLFDFSLLARTVKDIATIMHHFQNVLEGLLSDRSTVMYHERFYAQDLLERWTNGRHATITLTWALILGCTLYDLREQYGHLDELFDDVSSHLGSQAQLDYYTTQLCLLQSSISEDYARENKYMSLPWLQLQLVRQYLKDRGSAVTNRAILLQRCSSAEAALLKHRYAELIYSLGVQLANLNVLRRPSKYATAGSLAESRSPSTTKSSASTFSNYFSSVTSDSLAIRSSLYPHSV